MATHLARSITVQESDEASGLAIMIADLIRQNFADSRVRTVVAASIRGDVCLRAADYDQAVTVSFAGPSVSVVDGDVNDLFAEVDTPQMSGDWLDLSYVCTGQQSPFSAWRTGAVDLKPHGHLGRLAAVGFVLLAPATEEAVQRRRQRALITAVCVAGFMIVARLVRTRVR